MDQDWAICVGIGVYRARPGLADLPGALRDAAAMHAWLITAGGVPEKQAYLIRSPAPSEGAEAQPAAGEPTAAAIEKQLRDFYALADASAARGEGFRAGRRLWLYYAGHGLGFPEDKDAGILTADARPPSAFPHVAGHAWAEALRASAAFDEVVLFMDCCRSEANRIPLRRPDLVGWLAQPEGKMMAAYAVAENRASFEMDDGSGLPRGKFSLALERLLRAPRSGPIYARQFLDLLYLESPGVDTRPPSNPDADFVFLDSPTPLETAERPTDLLIAHGERTESLARRLAGAMASPRLSVRAIWSPRVHQIDASAFASVQQLVITRSVDLAELRQLVQHVAPQRTVLFAPSDPGVANVPGVSFVARDAEADVDVQAAVLELERSLREPGGRVEVRAHEALAQLRIWNDQGRTIATAQGTIRLEALPVGQYRARASLGAHYSEASFLVVAHADTSLTLPELPLRIPDRSSLVEFTHTPPDGRSVITVPLDGAPTLALSVPTVPGWRVEVFARPGLGSAGISLRMVPSSHPPGAPHPNDRLREALRLALAAPAWSGEGVGAEEVSGDPIAALLAAALRLRSGLPAEAWVDAAAAVLGDDDADVRLLRGATTLSSPAMLFFGWQHRLERGELAVVPGSSADAITGRQRIAAPWLTWNLDPKESASAWLANVAQSVWPGWDVAPNPQVAVADLAVAACALCAPAESVRALTYKSPPVDRLVQHQRIAFVGATNDQLPAALAVAFVERGKRRWPRLEIWSLEDRLLHSVVSHGETGEALLARRDRAEEQLSALLAVVADESSLERYDGFEVDGAWHFASLWDWEAPGGYVHTSAYYGRGQELRIAPAENLEWTSSEPPPGYAKASTAYTALRARHPSRGHR